MSLTGHRQAAKTTEADRLVIFLHGYGSNGQDLIGLAPYFAQLDPAADFLSPDAIERSPFNPGGFQWFSIPFIDGSTQEEMTRGLLHAHQALNNFIDQELEIRGLTPKDLVLVGFSQGTMLALHTGLRRKEQIGAIIGFSGRLLFPDLLENDAQSKPPIQLIHGEMDDVVPVNDSLEANKALRDAGINSNVHLSPATAHGIAQDGLEAALKFYAQTMLAQPKEST